MSQNCHFNKNQLPGPVDLLANEPYANHPALLVNNITVEGHLDHDALPWAALMMIILACVVCVVTPFVVKAILKRQGEGSTYDGLDGDQIGILPGVAYGRSADKTELAIEMGLADPTNMRRVGKFDPIDIQIS